VRVCLSLPACLSVSLAVSVNMSVRTYVCVCARVSVRVCLFRAADTCANYHVFSCARAPLVCVYVCVGVCVRVNLCV